jgi:membrane-associated protease RseP (regulator of RpoE activity)
LLGGIGGILAIIFFVTAHEFGHFVAAKAVGIKATEFFFGFGPKLWSFRKGETEYGIKLIPLGGYVRVVGMNPLEEVDPVDVGRTYREKPFWKKTVVVLAGVGMNFLIAYLIFAGVLLAGGIAELSTSIDEVVPTLEDGTATPAASAGLEPGDRIVSIDGVPTPDWSDISSALAARPDQEVVLVIEREGRQFTKAVTLGSRVDETTGQTRGFLGVAPGVIERSVGLWEATGLAGRQLGLAVSTTFEVFGRIVNPDTLARLARVFVGDTDIPDDIRPVSPIGVGNIGSQVDEFGVLPFLILLASVNVMLATLNVLPLYPLDGGHFAVALYEKVTRRPVNVRVLAPVAALVIALIGFLGLVGIILDIVNPIDI